MFRFSSATLLAALAVAGCADIDGYGTWQPTEANARNIAVMAANKRDLIRGRGAAGSDPVESASAVVHLWEGTPHALPVTSSKAGS